MYNLCGFGDPWDYFGVQATSTRNRAYINQGSRFGIGDVTFLAVAYGRMEYVVDTCKRLSKHTIHLTSGEKLENVRVILKALGLLGDYQVDRLHKMKQIVGLFCDGDWRRPISLDWTGMSFSNITTLSHLGDIGLFRDIKYLHDFPNEYYKIEKMGYIEQLPVHTAIESEDKPAYVGDVKHSMSAGMTLSTFLPKLVEAGMFDGEYKHRMYHVTNPTDYTLKECIKAWDDYQEKWHKEGFTQPYLPYPYSREMIDDYFSTYSQAVSVPCSAQGPPGVQYSESGKTDNEETHLGKLPTWAEDQGAVMMVQNEINQSHMQWWWSQGTGSDLFQRAQNEKMKQTAALLPPTEDGKA